MMFFRFFLFLYFCTVSFTDIFILEFEYIRFYTVFNLFLFILLINSRLRIFSFHLIIFSFLFLFIAYNLLFIDISFISKHFKYVIVFVFVIVLHLVTIVLVMRRIGLAYSVKYLKYGYYFTLICVIIEFLLNIFGFDVFLPGRSSIASARIFVKRAYFYATEPSTLASYIIVLSPIVFGMLKTKVERLGHIILSFLSVFGTLSIFSLIVYPVMFIFHNFKIGFLVLFFMFLLFFFVDGEIIDVLQSKILLEDGGSGGERSYDFMNSLSLLRTNFLFGNGWGIETYLFGTSAHNFHLSVLVSNGFIGYTFFLLYFLILNIYAPISKSKFNFSCWISIFLSAVFLVNSSSFYEPHYYLGMSFLLAFGDRGISLKKQFKL